MDEFDDSAEEMSAMDVPDAEKYTGAIWRKPTEQELDELAGFYADADVEADNRIFNLQMDHIEFSAAVKKRKDEIILETKDLAMVMDFVNFNVQVFYTFSFFFSAGKNSKTIAFTDNMSRAVKSKGVFREVEEMGEYLFDI